MYLTSQTKFKDFYPPRRSYSHDTWTLPLIPEFNVDSQEESGDDNPNGCHQGESDEEREIHSSMLTDLLKYFTFTTCHTAQS